MKSKYFNSFLQTLPKKSCNNCNIVTKKEKSNGGGNIYIKLSETAKENEFKTPLTCYIPTNPPIQNSRTLEPLLGKGFDEIKNSRSNATLEFQNQPNPALEANPRVLEFQRGNIEEENKNIAIKETIEKVFGTTRPPTPQEDLMIDIDEIISYYNCHGLTIAELKAIGGKDWEEVKRNPNMAKEMANAIRAMKNNPPSSICDVPIEELKEKAGEDWQELIENSERLYAFADAVSKQRLMEQGKIPHNYTAITHCKACGDVFVPLAIQNNGSVLGCPWCWNRARGFPVPKPSKFTS